MTTMKQIHLSIHSLNLGLFGEDPIETLNEFTQKH